MKDSRPLVSIGMPAYNGEKFIRKSLDALLAQDYENFELIISDNASTDRTWEICQEYAAKDPRIRLYANERNMGVWINFRAVLNLARGPYFMWAAVDDYWHPAFLSTLVGELESHPSAGAAMSGTEVVKEEGATAGEIRFSGSDDPNRKSYYGMFWGLTSPAQKKYNYFICGLLRTELAQEAFTFLSPATNGDRIFVSMLSLATRFRYVDRVLYTRRVHNESVTVKHGRKKPSDAYEDAPITEAEEIFKLGGVIWRSTLVPWRRKIYIPVGMLGLALRFVRRRLYRWSLVARVASYLSPTHKRHSRAK